MTPSVESHERAMASLSSAEEMRPMSSRSHSIFVPADNMIASAPQVTEGDASRELVVWLHATIGNVPFRLRSAETGLLSPRHTFIIPPVPKVHLAIFRLTHDCPMSDACWSPAMAAMGGEPGRAVATPMTPDDGTRVGSIEIGTPNTEHARSCHLMVSYDKTSASPVTAALL